MSATIAERIAAGAAFLDEHDPDWWRADVERAIDLDTLSLGDPNGCILGQRCPLEVKSLRGSLTPFAVYAATLSGLGTRAVGDWAAERGFEISDDDDLRSELDEYDDLTAEWKRVITERRSAP